MIRRQITGKMVTVAKDAGYCFDSKKWWGGKYTDNIPEIMVLS